MIGYSVELLSTTNICLPAQKVVYLISIVVFLCFQVVNIVTNQCVRRIGVIENTERFLHVALFQGAAEVRAHCTHAQ